MEIFNLEKQFAFYGAYHSNTINILIHMIFVWPILFTGLMLGHYIPFGFIPTVNWVTVLVFCVFFVSLDRKAGFLGAFLCLLCWFGASKVAVFLGFSLTWKVVLVAQLSCWTAQFLGHGVFEKRAPALLDNILQAFLMAPFFVLLEALQLFVEYEPYPGFHAKVKTMVEADIKEWQEKKQKKSQPWIISIRERYETWASVCTLYPLINVYSYVDSIVKM